MGFMLSLFCQMLEKGLVDSVAAVSLHLTNRVQGSCTVSNRALFCNETISSSLSRWATSLLFVWRETLSLSFIVVPITDVLEKIAQHKKIMSASAHRTY